MTANLIEKQKETRAADEEGLHNLQMMGLSIPKPPFRRALMVHEELEEVVNQAVNVSPVLVQGLGFGV
jgi:hypothetical protein